MGFGPLMSCPEQGIYVTFFGKTDTNAFPLNGQEKRL